MKIEKFSKQKNGMYLLSLEDGNKIRIHEDLILKYQLLLTKEVNHCILDELYHDNQIYEIYEVAVKYLNTRLRSRQELLEYLQRKGYEEELIDSVLELLLHQGYLDDKIYATSFVHDKILMSHYGPNKIISELEKAGISHDIIMEVITSFDDNLQKERMEKLIDRQIRTNHSKGSVLLKKKLQSYLLNLGYSFSLINEALNGKKLVDDDCYQKEYRKLYNRLSKKYSGKELEYKLKQKMYQKGFTVSDYE